MINGVYISSEQTKLMNTYRMAARLTDVLDLKVIHCPTNNSHICIFHSENGALCYARANAEDYELLNVGLKGKHYCAGANVDGRIAVLAGDGDRLSFSEQTSAREVTLSQARELNHGLPPGIQIEAIVCQENSPYMSHSYFAVAVAYKMSPGQKDYNIAYAFWNGSSTRFIPMRDRFKSKNIFIQYENGLELRGISGNNIEIIKIDKQQRYEEYRIIGSMPNIDVMHEPLMIGSNYVFAIVSSSPQTRGLSVICGSYPLLGWGGVTGRILTKDYDVLHYNYKESYKNDEVFIMAVGGNRMLYVANCGTYFPCEPSFTPILTNVDKVSFCRCHDHVLAFALDNTSGKLYSLVYQPVAKTWTIQEIGVKSEKQMMEFTGYSTQITLTNQDRTPAANIEVIIEATDTCKLIVGDNTCRMLAGDRTSVRTDKRGRLTFVQEGDDLNSVDLLLSCPALRGDGSVLIKPYKNVEKKLRAITPNALIAATDRNGKRILSEAYWQDAEPVCKAIKRLYSSVPQGTSLRMAEADSPVGCLFSGSREALLDLSNVNYAKALDECGEDGLDFQLDFSSGHAIFTSLTSQEGARAVLQAQNGMVDLPVWMCKIGTWIKAGLKHLVDTVKIVVHFISGAIEFAIELVIDGVKYVFNWIIKVAREVLGVVQVLLAKVGIDIQPMMDWLGFMLNWDDVIRCKTAFKNMFEQGLIFIQEGAVPIGKMINDKITDIQRDFDHLMETAKQSLIGTADFDTLMSRNVPPNEEYQNAISNNFLLDHLLEAEAEGLLEAVIDTDDVLDGIFNKLKAAIEECSLSADFEEINQYFTTHCQTPVDFLRGILAYLIEALRGVVNLALAGVKIAVELLFEALSAAAGALLQIVKKEVHVPFISQFYKLISGNSELSLLDVGSLMLAMVVTPIYKLIEGKPLFENDAAVKAFADEVDGHKLLITSGLLPNADGLVISTASKRGQRISKIFETSGVASYYCLSMLNDAGLELLPVVSSIIGGMQIVCEVTWQAAGCPWIYEVQTGDMAAKARALWCVCWLGVTLDTLWYCRTLRYPDGDNLGSLMSSVYGVFHLMASLDYFSSGPQGIDVATTVIPVVNEISKICLMSEIAIVTKGASLLAEVILDGVSAAAMAGLTVAALPPFNAPIGDPVK